MGTTSALSALPDLMTWGNPEGQRYLFLLSHMRSYSSLLSHVLGSSPDVDGYCEMHVRYRNKLDFMRLRYRIQRSTGKRLHGRWLLDKILHNYIRPPDRLLDKAQARAIVFVRKPEAAMRSILTLAQSNEQDRLTHTPQTVCDYYVSRLHRLRVDGERLGERALYFDAETLIDSPAEILGQLGSWLKLSEPLSPHYKLFPDSGRVLFGDPSANIRSGYILDSSASTIAEDIQIPTAILLEAKAAYQRCRAVLLKNCRNADAGVRVLPRRATITGAALDPSFI